VALEVALGRGGAAAFGVGALLVSAPGYKVLTDDLVFDIEMRLIAGQAERLVSGAIAAGENDWQAAARAVKFVSHAIAPDGSMGLAHLAHTWRFLMAYAAMVRAAGPGASEPLTPGASS